MEELLVVADNAPCHSKLEQVFLNSPASFLRLSPYSPMLNPIETIWSKMKCYIKDKMRIPNVEPPRVGEQRIIYLENLIVEAKNCVRTSDCSRAVMHCTTFYEKILAREDVEVGQ